ALQELKRLEAMPPMSAEATVSRNYLDWLIAVPWSKRTRERKDLLAAEAILNEDHYGLEKVKERIVEFLAVRQLVNKPKGPILCFVGPPGVGKTSLAKSIARCTNRKFVRMSLGGLRDEAGRPHDRNEALRLPGHTEREKVEIAKRHLIPKQLKSHGLRAENISFTEESLQEIIRRYTREAGVRNMEREISSICRKVARKVVLDGRGYQVEISAGNTDSYLGVPRYRASRQEEPNENGIAHGLAWT